MPDIDSIFRACTLARFRSNDNSNRSQVGGPPSSTALQRNRSNPAATHEDRIQATVVVDGQRFRRSQEAGLLSYGPSLNEYSPFPIRPRRRNSTSHVLTNSHVDGPAGPHWNDINIPQNVGGNAMGGPRPRLPYVDPLGPGSSGMAGRFTRGRAPSLGELHQELEQENEAQVNRLLFLITEQQAQLSLIQRHADIIRQNSDFVPLGNTEQLPAPPPYPASPPTPQASSPASRFSFSFRRRSSRNSQTPSTASPATRPVSSGLDRVESASLGGTPMHARDDSAYFQAETQMLTRENQMLQQRIRDLERQIAELSSQNNSRRNSRGGGSPRVASSLSAPPLDADNLDDLRN